MNCFSPRTAPALAVAFFLSLGGIQLLAQTIALPGLPALNSTTARLAARPPQVPPSERYSVSLDLAEVTHDLGPADAPEPTSDTPLQVGVVRQVQTPATEKAKRFQNADGTQLMIFAIKSPGARAVRVQFNHFNIAPGDEVYVRSAGGTGGVGGPYRVDGERQGEEFWSASVEGDTAVVEYHFRSQESALFVSAVAHIFKAAEADEAPDVLSCHIDASCSSTGPKDAVARIRYVSGSGVYVCTGTLLNNTTGDRTPYFYVANHCIGNQAEASSMETFWLYQTSACNAGTLRPDWQQNSAGADLLATSTPNDSTLLRLRSPAPSAVAFAGWNASAQSIQTPVFGLHHPDGYTPPSITSHLRRAQGSILTTHDACPDSGLTSGYEVEWTSGNTEQGSSGSGLFISDGAGTYLVGTLSCGPVPDSCSFRRGLYGKFANFFPEVRQYLDAGPLPAPVAQTAASVWSYGFQPAWTPVANATGYRLDVSTSSDFSSYVGVYQNYNVGSYSTVDGLSPNTTYYYRIRAYNSNETSPNSNTVAVTTRPPLISVTVNTTPGALQFMVDNVTYTGPRTFQWYAGSTHTIAAFTQPGTFGSRYVWTRWSDGGAISHTVAPTANTAYVAEYVRQYPLTTIGWPAGSVSPADGWYDFGTSVTLTAIPEEGDSFVSWAGTGFGSYTGSVNPIVVTMNAAITQRARFSGGAEVVVRSQPGGWYNVDGVSYQFPQVFYWAAGSPHTLEALSPQSPTSGVRYVWRSWSDGEPASHVVAPASDTVYVVDYGTQYYLTMSPNGGTVTPASGWYDAGENVAIFASRPGYVFNRWQGTGNVSYNGTANPATVRMGGPISQVPVFYPVVKPDFDRNDHSDIVWQNSRTGERAVWLMDGRDLTGEHFLPTVAPAWQIATSADFNRDGHVDIVWQNNQNGQRVIWLMNNGQIVGESWLPLIPLVWQIAGSGDFNQDQKTDLVWQNSLTGQRTVWFMNDAAYAYDYPLQSVGVEWQIAAVADFNQDSRPDLLWQNQATGQRAVWLMSGIARTGERFLPAVETAWQIGGAGDYNADGYTDILWQHTQTGQRAIWFMNETTLAGEHFLPAVSTEWQIRNH